MKLLKNKIILVCIIILIIGFLAISYTFNNSKNVFAATNKTYSNTGTTVKGKTNEYLIEGTEDGKGNVLYLNNNKGAYLLIRKLSELMNSINSYKEGLEFNTRKIQVKNEEIKAMFLENKEGKIQYNILNNLKLEYEANNSTADELVDKYDETKYSNDISKIMEEYGLTKNNADAETMFCLFSGQPFPSEIWGQNLYFFTGKFEGEAQPQFVTLRNGEEAKRYIFETMDKGSYIWSTNQYEKEIKVDIIDNLTNPSNKLNFNTVGQYAIDANHFEDPYFFTYVKRSDFAKLIGISEEKEEELLGKRNPSSHMIEIENPTITDGYYYKIGTFYSKVINATDVNPTDYSEETGIKTTKDTTVESENKESNFDFDIDYSDTISYILSEKSDDSYWENAPKQKALWSSVLNRRVSVYRGSHSIPTLYSEAERYREYVAKLGKIDPANISDTIELGYNTLDLTTEGNYVYAGPFCIKYGDGQTTEFAKITDAYLSGVKKGNKEFTDLAYSDSSWTLVDEDKKTFSTSYNFPASGKEFYIRIDKKSDIKEINNLKFNIQGISAKAEYTTFRNIYVVYQPWKLQLERHTDEYNCNFRNSDGTQYIMLRALVKGFGSIDNIKGGKDTKGWGDSRAVNQQDILMLKWAKRITQNYTAEIEFEGIFGMDLSGKVWLDEPTSGKDPSAANGKMASTEKKVQGVKVYLCDSNGTVITDTDIVAKNPVTTDKNGYYEFKEIPIDDYKIKFEYNGMLYIATKKVEPKNKEEEKIVSKATEIGRTSYNNKFNTITLNNAYGSAGNIKLSYADGSSQENPRESILNTGTKVTEYSSYIKLETTKETKQVTCGSYIYVSRTKSR